MKPELKNRGLAPYHHRKEVLSKLEQLILCRAVARGDAPDRDVAFELPRGMMLVMSTSGSYQNVLRMVPPLCIKRMVEGYRRMLDVQVLAI